MTSGKLKIDNNVHYIQQPLVEKSLKPLCSNALHENLMLRVNFHQKKKIKNITAEEFSSIRFTKVTLRNLMLAK